MNNSTVPWFTIVPSSQVTFTANSYLSPFLAVKLSALTVVAVVVTNKVTTSLSTETLMNFNPSGTV